MVDISHYSNKNVYNVSDNFSEAELSIMDQRDRVDSQMERRWKVEKSFSPILFQAAFLQLQSIIETRRLERYKT